MLVIDEASFEVLDDFVLGGQHLFEVIEFLLVLLLLFFLLFLVMYSFLLQL